MSTFCSDINECEYPETYPCYGNCKNTEGGYQCLCAFGFKGNASIPNGCKGNATQDRVVSYYTFMSTMAYFGST
jgi:hypothetical protein